MSRTANILNFTAVLFVVGLFLASIPAAAQSVKLVDGDDWCSERNKNGDKATTCEVREFTIEARDLLRVDAGMNGGVSVRGWEGDNIQVQARVQTRARTQARADELAASVELQTGRIISAETEEGRKNESTSVSYRIFVPHQSNLDLETFNGGISIKDVSGKIKFNALNGGVKLDRLAGNVEGKTTNGGVKIALAGDSWDGEGLNVKTTNGGVTVSVPKGYNADFETGTVNGRLNLDFPMTVSGRVDRKIRTTLGDGGAPIRVSTTNGGVTIKR